MSRTTLARRRTVVGAAAAVATALILTGCGSSGPADSSNASGDGLTMWALNDQTILQQSVEAYNADHPDAQIDLQLYANDDYKTKLRTAMGAGQGPDIFFNWGGGALQDYVDNGDVAEISSDVDTSRFTPSVLDTATFDGTVYGVPANGLAPVVLYYNKSVLEANGLQPATSMDELLSQSATLSNAGITPISLAAGSKWPTLMFEEYLLDRVGGPEVFESIEGGDSSAWEDPSVTEANRLLQQLTGAGAFGDNASSVAYDQGASTALLYTGQAAYELMGTWEYANIVKAAPDFVSSGDLGYTTFPSVEGGEGDPANIVGNPSNFLSVNAASDDIEDAMTYLADYVMDDDQISAYIESGSVPPVNGLEDQLTGDDADWLQFVYGLVQDAPSFQLSWDQALPSDQADPLLTAIDSVFLGQSTPEEFGTTMSQVG